MALDGAFLHIIKEDLIARGAIGSRIDRIFMPYKDQIILHLSSREFDGRLLISANAVTPRIHLTEIKYENPKEPPMLCMLFRKKLVGGRLITIRQPELERILFFDFECKNELGDIETITMICEFLGRSSNILLVCNEKIIDAVRRVYPESGTRILLPGSVYELPKSQNKLNFLTQSIEKIVDEVKKAGAESFAKSLQAVMDGSCPLVCREICYAASKNEEMDFDRLGFFIKRTAEQVKTGGTPTFVSDKNGKPMDFTYMPVSQYGVSAVTKTYESPHLLLDDFFAARDKKDHLKNKAQDILKLLVNLSERQVRKIAARTAELQAAKDREYLRIYGELIKANLYKISPGDSRLVTENYYDEGKEIAIPLDVALSPVANAQKYFKEYRKATTASQMLEGLIQEAQNERLYLDSVFDALGRAESAAELSEIKVELCDGGYIKTTEKKRKKTALLPPRRFRSDDGFLILVGRNNYQNDELTFHMASKSDIWLHVKDIPGSHTIIFGEGKPISAAATEQAAILAVVYSKAAKDVYADVDFAPVKLVKKPAGAKAGMVIYSGNKTARVKPDEDLAVRLRVEEGK